MEPRRPLIIVQNQIVPAETLEQRRRKEHVDTSKLEKETAISSKMKEDECAICLTKFNFSDRNSMITSEVEPDEVSKLLCGHVFHYECLKRWFQSTSKNECPFCRQKALDI